MARPRGTKEKTISQLWDENKEVLEAADYTKRTFIDNMEAIKKSNNVRTPGAWKIFKHKVDFTSKEQIGAENMVAGIKDQMDYNTFRKEVVGWKKKIDYSKFSYIKDENRYRYENSKGEVFVFTLVSGSAGSQYWKWTKVR